MLNRTLTYVRLRFTEWAISIALLFWGIIVYSQPGLFDSSPNFAQMENIASQNIWGGSAIFIGLLRIIFLTINGTYQQSAHIRAIGSALGFTFWFAIFVAYFNLSALIPNLATIGTFAILDLHSAWWAATDAKLADIRAKQEKQELAELRKLHKEKE